MIDDKLLLKIQKCKKCKTISEYKKFNALAHGNRGSKYALISEAPGYKSVSKQQYWTGRSGQILRECAKNAGISLERTFYMTDVVKCWPKKGHNGNRPPEREEISNCLPFLQKEMDTLKPKVLLVFGQLISELCLNKRVMMSEIHGKRHHVDDQLVLTLYHPSYILRKASKDPAWLTNYQILLEGIFKEIKTGNILNFENDIDS